MGPRMEPRASSQHDGPKQIAAVGPPVARTVYVTRMAKLDFQLRIMDAVKSMLAQQVPICGRNVDPDYVLRALNADKYDYIVVAEAEDGYKGFIVAYDVEDGVYLDVVCAQRGFGGPLIQNFMAFVKNEQLGNLSLSSLINVLAFYDKLGFKFRKQCGGPVFDFKTEFPDLWAKYKAKALQLSEIANARGPLVRETQVAYEEPVMIQVMQILIAQGLMGEFNANACKNKDLAQLSIPALQSFLKSKSCGSDGFTMIDCNVPPPLRYPSPIAMYSRWIDINRSRFIPSEVVFENYGSIPWNVVELKSENFVKHQMIVDRAKKATKKPRVAVNVKTDRPMTRSRTALLS